MKLRHGARTDVGKTRDHNEDNFGVGSGEQIEQLGELLVICDGMGGHAAGEVASQIGVETILSVYYAEPGDDRPHALELAFARANTQIYARGQGSMGTTGVAALLHHDALHIANVGDSRAYLIRDGAIRQVSRDHSFVGDQVAAGLITADQARLSPHRNVITRALGYQPEVSVDLFRLPLQIGDTVVLSSDGMHGLVLDEEILEIAGALDPEPATQRLIDLANSRGGTDNITVVVAHVDALDWYDGEDQGDQQEEPLRERATIPLPVTAPHSAIPEPTSAEPASAAPAPARTARTPIERRLSMLGGLLAVGLLVALLSIIVFAMNTPPVLAPGAAQPVASTPAATVAATSGPATLTTSTPATPATTANPSGQPTSAPTAAP